MIHAGIRTITTCGWAAFAMVALWFLAVGATLGVPPHPRQAVGYPIGETYHSPDCPFIKTDDPENPVLWFTGADQIAASGRRPCPVCLSGQGRESETALLRAQIGSPRRIGLGQTQHSD